MKHFILIVLVFIISSQIKSQVDWNKELFESSGAIFASEVVQPTGNIFLNNSIVKPFSSTVIQSSSYGQNVLVNVANIDKQGSWVSIHSENGLPLAQFYVSQVGGVCSPSSLSTCDAHYHIISVKPHPTDNDKIIFTGSYAHHNLNNITINTSMITGVFDINSGSIVQQKAISLNSSYGNFLEVISDDEAVVVGYKYANSRYDLIVAQYQIPTNSYTTIKHHPHPIDFKPSNFVFESSTEKIVIAGVSLRSDVPTSSVCGITIGAPLKSVRLIEYNLGAMKIDRIVDVVSPKLYRPNITASTLHYNLFANIVKALDDQGNYNYFVSTLVYNWVNEPIKRESIGLIKLDQGLNVLDFRKTNELTKDSVTENHSIMTVNENGDIILAYETKDFGFFTLPEKVRAPTSIVLEPSYPFATNSANRLFEASSYYTPFRDRSYNKLSLTSSGSNFFMSYSIGNAVIDASMDNYFSIVGDNIAGYQFMSQDCREDLLYEFNVVCYNTFERSDLPLGLNLQSFNITNNEPDISCYFGFCGSLSSPIFHSVNQSNQKAVGDPEEVSNFKYRFSNNNQISVIDQDGKIDLYNITIFSIEGKEIVRWNSIRENELKLIQLNISGLYFVKFHNLRTEEIYLEKLFMEKSY